MVLIVNSQTFNKGKSFLDSLLHDVLFFGLSSTGLCINIMSPSTKGLGTRLKWILLKTCYRQAIFRYYKYPMKALDGREGERTNLNENT